MFALLQEPYLSSYRNKADLNKLSDESIEEYKKARPKAKTQHSNALFLNKKY